ncbi:trehalose-phosphatase [Loktanella sp. M215]|uniref:trehalose-phosphatase n=1 Tax=Loktanella sp. M215 TaxID=2675431 RepID=UPI001F015D9A|nr:trehalose-phosphatase [Loktanella sp. M215]MCF7699541.1 trehalose-phosphatase [Loktanella sp. M215]
MTESADILSNLTTDDIYLFLDFDGTLVELAPTPDGITVPADLSELLSRLHRRLDGRLALVSGREIATLERFLPDFPGDIFGAHGAEARRNGTLARHALVGSKVVADVQTRARKDVAAVAGLTLETKDTGAVIHYRGAPDAANDALVAAQGIADAADGMELHTSKMAYEIRPADASKAGAVRRVMDDQPKGIRPTVIGDDVTDEEAMVVANERGGFSIRVGDGDTCAAYRLPDPAAVRRLLQDLTAQGAA